MKEDCIIFPATRTQAYKHLRIKLGIPKSKMVFKEVFDLFYYKKECTCELYERYYTDDEMNKVVSVIGIAKKLPVFLEIKNNDGIKKAKEYYREKILKPLKSELRGYFPKKE
jgi:hypothetical protein